MVLNHDEDVGSVSTKKDKHKSDVFGVLVKLKIPKQDEEENDRCGKKDDMMKRVCYICEKEFRSGKALGGHMRSHVQFHRNMKKEKSEKKKKAGGDCVICGKKFPSMKSLFGHMRCHPERDWRGINPPPNLTRAVDLTESLRGWAVTAKRGRKATAEDDRLRDAVNFLMTLASAQVKEMGGDGVGKGESDELKKKVKLRDLNDKYNTHQSHSLNEC